MQRRGFFCNSIKQHGIPPGISLVEVVVAMGIASVLMGVSMTTMHTVMRTERETSKAVWLGSSFHRFSRLIRSDIHAAASVEFLEGATLNSPELTIQKPGDEVVKYRIQGDRIFRVVTRKTQQVHQDGFYLPEGSHAYFFQRKRLNQAGISIDEPLQSDGGPEQAGTENRHAALKELSIVSAIGHDYRLTDIQIKPPKKETK
tara:strand:+ start:4129 stop:4734 length:606 start_codon:yes stop_codon:yes gene_type:complete